MINLLKRHIISNSIALILAVISITINVDNIKPHVYNALINIKTIFAKYYYEGEYDIYLTTEVSNKEILMMDSKLAKLFLSEKSNPANMRHISNGDENNIWMSEDIKHRNLLETDLTELFFVIDSSKVGLIVSDYSQHNKLLSLNGKSNRPKLIIKTPGMYYKIVYKIVIGLTLIFTVLIYISLTINRLTIDENVVDKSKNIVIYDSTGKPFD